MFKRIKWNNYATLGNLDLDFSKNDGSIYKTIILAGENGIGKTTILETLANYLHGLSLAPFLEIEYVINNELFGIIPDKTYLDNGFHIRIDKSSQQRKVIQTGFHNQAVMLKDELDQRSYGFVYSKARAGFNTKPVRTITTTQLDNEKFELDNKDDFTNVKQLLIDIEQQDDASWRNLSREGSIDDSSYEKFEKEKSKSFRFKNAFNSFFDNSLKYVGIDNNSPSEKIVIFEKNGKNVSIDQLSTGEKQIVFRGAQLLKNLNNIKNGIVLIDEPELSLHPRWQERILDYYRNLFTVNGQQTVQLIIATHSEYVIKSAVSDLENVLVISMTDDHGSILSRRITAPDALPSITAAEINYLAFNIASIDYHIALYGYIQSSCGSPRIQDCDEFISKDSNYSQTEHEKIDSYRNYKTLPTYIRNAIDHPDSGRTYSEIELKTSIDLMRQIIKNLNKK